MHAQTESVPEHRAEAAASLHVAVGLGLAPLAWSLLGLALPGHGWPWQRRLGARRPSAEEAMVVAEALEQLRSADPSLPQRLDYYVLDDPLPAATVRARTLILSRGLIESDSLAPVLAHELGHAETLDGRLTEALGRLAIWDDPLGPQLTEGGEEVRVEFEQPGGGLLWGCARWALRLAGGGFTQRLLEPLWAAHWRAREYAADAHAAALGQAEDLARHLTDYELPFDAPQRRFLWNASQHPPVALRVQRLREGFAARARVGAGALHRERVRPPPRRLSRPTPRASESRGGFGMTKIEPGRFTRAAIHNEVGEAELRLSAAGNWQLHLRAVEEREWRLACSGGFEEGGVVSASPPEDRRLQIGRLLLDTGARCAFVDGRELPLTPREYALLAMLCADPERVFTVAEIQLRAFSYGAAVTTCRSVAAHAS